MNGTTDAGDNARTGTQAPSEDKSTPNHLKPVAARAHERHDEWSQTHDFDPAIVKTQTDKYAVDHIQHRKNALRCVNYADNAGTEVKGVVEFPFSVIEYIERYPAAKAVENSPLGEAEERDGE